MIGRSNEIRILKNAVESQQPEFIAVFGRRRVGKTYLVREFFDNKFTFSYTGALNCSTKTQLSYFHDSLTEQGLADCPAPKTWPEAFKLLKQIITQSTEKRKVVFLDELPWMDAPRSGFMSAFEHFWNSWGSAQKDLMLIICGSSTSWITNKVLRNRGGLHNRVTKQIHLYPFTLLECEEYSKALDLGLNRNQIIEGYMVMGGVPLYWSKLDKSKSLAQNINDIFIAEGGELRYEFSDLYASVFNRPEKYFKIIECLSIKKAGMTRAEIISAAKIDSNGKLSEMLEDLIQCGFIRKYCHTNKQSRDALYQLVDFYTLFYYSFVKDAHGTDENYWLKLLSTPTYHTWCGLAFERVCLMHTKQIKQALGISGIMANVFSWQVKKTDEHPGVQIDLLIDRADDVVSICEMKYAPNGYTMTAAEAEKIRTRLSVYSLYLPVKKGMQLVMITSNGIKNKGHLLNINKELTANDLFS
jgi:hypothetical protein